MFDRAKVLATVISIGLVAAACGGTAAPSPAPATQGASAAPTQPAGELPKPELTKLRIGISAPNEPVQYAEKYADTLGLYQKYGITTIEVTGFEGDGKALQALVAGQLDMFVGGASTAINSVTTDTPVKVLSMNSTTLDDGLFCGKDIKTPADVKGKTVAISTFGGTSHGSAILLLQSIGLTPKDATITQTGNEGTRIAALKGGSVGCAVVGISQKEALTATGLNVVADLTKAKLQWGRSGLMARTDFLQKNPNTVLVAVAATLEAQTAIFKDPKAAAEKFAAWAQIKPEQATVAVNAFLGYGSASMKFTDDAFKAPRDVLATVNPAVANVDITKAYDLSVLKKLEDIGFYKKIGAATQ
jgi:NitT/TauT family transport system substrate-binding protein